MSETTKTTGKCHVCNCQHPTLGLRRDEMDWPTTIVGNHEVHKACAHEYENARKMRSEVHMDGLGCYRWNSNNHVPFSDMLRMWDVDEATIARCEQARAIDDAKAIAEYKQMRAENGYSAEEIAEARNAHDGQPVVDIITGQRIC
jgi:glutamate synthase domain-containing protein 2